MRSPGGYAQVIDPDAPIQEYDTVACAHCGTVIFVKPNTLSTTFLVQRLVSGVFRWDEEPGAACWTCGQKPVCLACYDKGTCTPFERWLDQKEGNVQAKRSLLIAVPILLFTLLATPVFAQTAAALCSGPVISSIEVGQPYKICWNHNNLDTATPPQPAQITGYKIFRNGAQVTPLDVTSDPPDAAGSILSAVQLPSETTPGTIIWTVVATNDKGDSVASDPLDLSVVPARGKPAKPGKPVPKR